MAETNFVPNFGGMQDFSIEIYDAAEVPEELWAALQDIHNESIRAGLPMDKWPRADVITRKYDLPTYVERRVRPQLQSGRDGWNDQLFRDPLVAVVHDSSNQPVCGVVTTNNTSASDRTPALLRKPEMWLKMVIPPDIRVPKFGGKRYVHFREAYVHPDAQHTLDTRDGTVVVSGIALSGLYYSLHQRDQTQITAAYVVRGDPADYQMEYITAALGMHQTGFKAPNSLPGYKPDAPLVRLQRELADMAEDISEMPGANQVLGGIAVNVIRK